MKAYARSMTLAVALAVTSQPCIASVESSNTVPATTAINFSLARHPGPANMASMTLAASQQTADESEDQPRRKGLGTTTLLIVGGVVLLVLVAAAVAGAQPTAGPNEGAFD